MIETFTSEKNFFRPLGASTFPLSFFDSGNSKILSFSYTLISVRRSSRKTSTIPTYHGNSKKRLFLKDTTKNSITAMETSSLINTEFGSWNYASLIEENRFSIYNTIYISLKLACGITRKTKTYFRIKTKTLFQNQRFG